MKKLVLILKFFCLFAMLNSPVRIFSQTGYFQQDVMYTIQVRLDDKAHFLRGNWTLVYKNNSPVVLDSLILHLWPNAYQNRKTEFAKQQLEAGSFKFHDSNDSGRGYIDSLQFSAGTVLSALPYKNYKDIIVLKLVSPLEPGESVSVSTPFRVKIPSDFSRFGHNGQQYQITQWYPKPAVFDRDGWHPIPYLDQGEFYSEYGSYDVSITLNKNYVVGSTGDLPMNDPELKWLASRESQSRAKLAGTDSLQTFKMEFGENEFKTLKFHQENVHDFAWFCDKQYYVLSTEIKLPVSGRAVKCVAMFPAKVRKTWKTGEEMVARGVMHYSKYNGDYPYNHCTAVEGALKAGGGMEYPNITVVSAGGSENALEEVIVHEVGHNWFYGILGTNERLHPWMDEGVNSYFENRFEVETHNGETGMIPEKLQKRLGIRLDHTRLMLEAYRLTAGNSTDQPMELPAQDYSGLNYGAIVYMKTGLSFRYLEGYLGREAIDKCFKAYFEKWKFKHPRPEDMQEVFESTSGVDLDWFFIDFVRTNEKLDFRIQSMKDGVITVKNFASFPAPACISTMDREGKIIQTYWTKPFTGTTTLSTGGETFHTARINAEGIMPELKMENNNLKSSGVFRRCKPMAFSFLYKFPDPNKTTFNWAPVIGFNTTDGFMAGLALYHNVFPKKRFEFYLMPMFGFRQGKIAGMSGGIYRIPFDRVLRKIELGSHTAFFSDLLRTHNSVVVHFRDKNMRKPINQTVGAHLFHLSLREPSGISLENYYQPVYGSLRWSIATPYRIHGFKATAEVGTNLTEKVTRASLELNYYQRFTKKIRGNFRFFGAGIASNGSVPWLLQYRMGGSNDPFGQAYLADRAGRTSWLWHQRTLDHGGFRSLETASFNKWLFATNATLSLPLPLLSVFGDAGAGKSSSVFGQFNTVLYDAGFSLSVLKDAITFNFPVVGSVYNNTLPEDFKDFWQNVTFSLDFMKMKSAINIPGM